MKSLWTIAIAAALLLLGMNLWFGDLNQDEGWYLYAARMVAEGRQPYADFAFTQGPVMPYVYALSLPWVDAWGVAGGRLFTGVLGLAGAFCAAWLAGRMTAGDDDGDKRRAVARLLTFILVGVNVYQWRYLTMVKTYGACGLFLMMGFLLLTVRHSRRGVPAVVLSGVTMALAAGTRSSAGVVIPLVFAWLWMERRREIRSYRRAASSRERSDNGASIDRRTPLWFAAGAGVTLAVCFLPFLIMAPEGLWFGLVEYHAGRSPGGLGPALAYKAGFVSRLVQAYFVAIAVAVVLGVLRLARGWRAAVRNLSGAVASFPGLVLASVLVVTLVHILAPFPYEDYQVIVYPLFAAVIAKEISAFRFHPSSLSVSLCLLLSLAAAFSSPVNQEWFVAGRDRVWWPLKAQTSLANLRTAAVWVRGATKSTDLLLTEDAYLAVEAGRRVPQGLELGPFSYYPDMDRERAARLRVLNREMMWRLLKSTPAPVAALSEWSFAIGAPAVAELSPEEQETLWRLVRDRYWLAAQLDGFGQGRTTLRLYRAE